MVAVDAHLTEPERVRIRLAFRSHGELELPPDLASAQLDRIIGIVASAGARETLMQASGEVVPASMTEFRDCRIYCLVKSGMHVEESEPWVAALFKVTRRRAQQMVRSAFSRFAGELDGELLDAIRAALTDGTHVPPEAVECVHVRTASYLVYRWLTDQARLAGYTAPTATSTASEWRLQSDAYTRLCDLAGVPSPERKEPRWA